MSSGGVENQKNKFISILGRELFDDLMENWYEKAVSGGWRYVVFVVRRSYILALILERFSNKKMTSDSSTTFLTDSSIVRYCDEIADFYEEHGYFPKILLCDDILIHGRNVNYVIDRIERRVIERLDGIPEEAIKNDLAKAINIHIFVTNDAPLSLLSRYLPILVTRRIEAPAFWHNLSSDVSAYVNCTGIANAVYVFNRVLTKRDFNVIRKNVETISTSYQNVDEDSYVRLYESEPGLVKWASAIRFLWFTKDECNAIPFVYLPELDAEEQRILIKDIERRVDAHEYYKAARKLIKRMTESKDSRGINELLTYILSCTVIHECCEASSVDFKIYSDAGVFKKLARHLGVQGVSEQNTINALQQLCECPVYDTTDDIDDFLQSECLGVENYLLEYDVNAQNVDKDDIKLFLENYFYINGRNSEYKVYSTRRVQRVFDSYTSYDESNTLNNTLNEICGNYNKTGVKYAFMYMMQMMDAGVFSVSGNAADDKPIGYHQLAKAGEQALLILPLRMDLFVPLITRIFDYCTLRKIEPNGYIEKFFDSPYGKEIIEDAQSKYGETIDAFRVINFLDNLKYMGQTPGDWNGDYNIRLPYFKEASISDVIAYNERKDKYVKMYDSYCVGTRE